MNFTDVDFSLLKNFRLSESKSLQFRFEAFNVFNHVVWAIPGSTGGTSAPSIAPSFSGGAVGYGTAAAIEAIASTPRELQMAVKFAF
jgi:hypothetical protein